MTEPAVITLTVNQETMYTFYDFEALFQGAFVWDRHRYGYDTITLPKGVYEVRVQDGVLSVQRVG